MKNIVFDCGDVLVKFDGDRIVREFAEEKDLEAMKKAVFHDWGALDAGTKEYREYIREAKSMLPERLWENAERFFEGWYRKLPYVEGSCEFVREMKDRGYGLYLLSNAPVCFAENWRLFEILEEFNGILFSGPVKTVKPGDEIYQELFKRFRLDAGECLFVDDREENVRAGERNGMKGVVFRGDWKEVLEKVEQEK